MVLSPTLCPFDLESANRFTARNRGWCLISGVASGLPAAARGIGGGMSRETDGVDEDLKREFCDIFFF